MRCMNILLLRPEERIDAQHWRIRGTRFRHITTLLERRVGDAVRAGILDGKLGSATITEIDPTAEQLLVSFTAEQEPPAALPLKLILALPRPKMLKRVLIDASSLGIKQIVLLNSWKVDKSYWQTPHLKADLLREKLLLGLEQAMDTTLPELILAPRFKPFVEDQLASFCLSSRKIMAHPGDFPPLPHDISEPVTLAVGPEGGWTEYEKDMFESQGFECHALGQRILRVETALPTLVGRMMRLI